MQRKQFNSKRNEKQRLSAAAPKKVYREGSQMSDQYLCGEVSWNLSWNALNCRQEEMWTKESIPEFTSDSNKGMKMLVNSCKRVLDSILMAMSKSMQQGHWKGRYSTLNFLNPVYQIFQTKTEVWQLLAMPTEWNLEAKIEILLQNLVAYDWW